MMMKDLVAKPFTVQGQVVTSRQIADAIDMIANLPLSFIAMDLVPAVLPGQTFHAKQEALNRLFQRWRKLNLVCFTKGRWSLVRPARDWQILQDAAQRARSDAPDTSQTYSDTQ